MSRIGYIDRGFKPESLAIAIDQVIDASVWRDVSAREAAAQARVRAWLDENMDSLEQAGLA